MPQSFKAHRRRCESVLRTLDLPTPFTIEAFCARLGAQRGRPIELLPMTSQDPPWGFWIAGRRVDWIFYETRTSPFHRQQLILLQLGHLVLGHPPSVRADQVALPQFLGNLDSQVAHELQGLGRAVYQPDPDAELQADLFGCLLLQRISQAPTTRDRQEPDRGRVEPAALRRLAAVLEGRPR